MELISFDIDSLFKACKVLFGEEVQLNRHFLEYIQESGIKSAFRQKALHTHPDRVIHLTLKLQEQSKELFLAATEAYRELLEFVRARDEKRLKLEEQKGSNFSTHPQSYNLYRYYKGPLPKREMLFAEFLYYSGHVPWKAFIDSIVWQRQLRPRFGEIAKSWKYISEEQIRQIIRGKLLGERIGEAAVRMAMLTNLQVKTIVLHQRMRQKRIGEYFVLHGFLNREQVEQLYYQFRQHNALYRAKKLY